MARRIRRRRSRTQWTHSLPSFWKKSKRARSRKLCKLLFMRRQSEDGADWRGLANSLSLSYLNTRKVFGEASRLFFVCKLFNFIYLARVVYVLVSARTRNDMKRKKNYYVSLFFTTRQKPTKKRKERESSAELVV